jgi:phage terminase Nu1 subunit (DNA packaging protein)
LTEEFKEAFRRDIRNNLKNVSKKDRIAFLRKKIKELKKQAVADNFKELTTIHIDVLKEELKSLTDL